MKFFLGLISLLAASVAGDEGSVRGVASPYLRQLQESTVIEGVDASNLLILPIAGGDANNLPAPSGSMSSVSVIPFIANILIPQGGNINIVFSWEGTTGADGSFGPFPLVLGDASTGTSLLLGSIEALADGVTTEPKFIRSTAFITVLRCDFQSFLTGQLLLPDGTLFTPPGSGSVLATSASPAQVFLSIGGVSSQIFNAICAGEGGGQGDPHFKTWSGRHYDYHGMCDMVMLDAPHFNNDMGLDLHIRTKLHKQFSYIANAAFRFGTDVFEVIGRGLYFLNGERVAWDQFPITIGDGYEVTHERSDAKHHSLLINMREEGKVVIKSYTVFISIAVDAPDDSPSFKGALGLMGEFGTGRLVGRDGKTVIDDLKTFGEEWQVLASEDMIFHEVEGPQHPAKCVMPSVSAEERRRLGGIDRATAEKACAEWPEDDKDDCIFDVMATGDLEMASAGAF